MVYQAQGDKVKVTVDSIGSDGKPTHYQWTGKLESDPVSGDPLSDPRWDSEINEHLLGFNVMKGRTYYQQSDCRVS